MGGIVLKQVRHQPLFKICACGWHYWKTLVSAHERLSLYGPILSDIRAVIFFGTPHQGSDLASRLEVLGRVLECVGIGSNAILTALTRDGLYLTNLAKSFVDRSSNLRIISFFEQLKVRGVNNVVSNPLTDLFTSIFCSVLILMLRNVGCQWTVGKFKRYEWRGHTYQFQPYGNVQV